MSVRKIVVRASCVVSSVVAIAIAAGCGSPVSQDSASSSTEALATGCAAIPFTRAVFCGEGTVGSSNTLDVGHPGLTTEFGGRGVGTVDPCQCESLVAPPPHGRNNPKISMSCYASPTAPSPRLAPPGPAGCTAGVTLTTGGMPLRDGTIAANTWVCPAGATIPSNLGAAPTCDKDPSTDAPGTWPSSGTSSQCEYIYWGNQSDGYGYNDCFGDPTGGFFLVQERIFTTIPFDAGSNQGDGGCTAMCCMPIGGGSGGGVLPPVGKAAQQ